MPVTLTSTHEKHRQEITVTIANGTVRPATVILDELRLYAHSTGHTQLTGGRKVIGRMSHNNTHRITKEDHHD